LLKQSYFPRIVTLALLFYSIGGSQAHSQDSVVSLDQALKATKILADLRLRYEAADFANITENANALTYRARLGFETGAFADTKFLIELDHNQALIDDFNSTLNGNTDFPVIADPNVTELNRLQLTNTSLPDTTVTLGRQRIILDDARFVGNVGWRQDEQTYDAIRVVNNSIENVTFDVSYINQVNRIFGDEAPSSKFDSESWILNAGYSLQLEKMTVKIKGYGYFLDLSNTALSSQTYGATVDVKSGIWKAKAGLAVQSDFGNQPTEYKENYYVFEAGVAQNGLSGLVGYEVLSGDGTKAFTTPLATLHKFNGFTDVFLNTPADGLEDLYVKAGYKSQAIGSLKYINVFGVYHDFNSSNLSQDLGRELNAVISTQIGKTKILFKYADYTSDGFATDRRRYSVQLDYKF